MTPEDFTSLAQRLAPGVQVRVLLDSVQFRFGGRAFATLGWPAPGWAVIKLSKADQARALAASDAFSLEPGRRRASGVTLVRLGGVDPDVMAGVLAAAWREAYGVGALASETSPAMSPVAGRN